MSIATSQQITKYYDLFRAIDVTFTKEIIRATGLMPQQVFVKCMGEQWPCVVYATSFAGAKVIASVKPALFDKIRKANNLVSLRFSFKDSGKSDPVTFFVAGKVLGFSPYNQGSGDLQFISLQYTQRPPDPLIEVIGRLLEANINSSKRRDERILITNDSMRKLGLMARETLLFVQGVPRKCIIRDLAFSGVKVIIVGIAKFLVDKPCTVRIEMEDPREAYDIRGMVVRFEPVEGRKDLAAVAVTFDAASVPMTYKMHINDYLAQIRKPGAGSEQEAEEARAEASAKSAAPVKPAPPRNGGGSTAPAPGTAPPSDADLIEDYSVGADGA